MAALQHAILSVGVTLAAAVTEGQAVTAAGIVAGAGLNALGFAQSAGAIGARISLTSLGIAKAIAGAAIAAGSAVELNATGQVITKAAGVAVGRALTAAAALGDEVEVFVIPN